VLIVALLGLCGQKKKKDGKSNEASGLYIMTSVKWEK